MAQAQVRDTDIAVLVAAIQSSVGPIHVDAEKVARQLGMSLSSIPPKFTAIRKRYEIDIKVVNSGALQRNRVNSPKKRLSGNASSPKAIRNGENDMRGQRNKAEPRDLAESLDSFIPKVESGSEDA